ncbi:unnamed protein product, partial [marine sediment metagenome]
MIDQIIIEKELSNILDAPISYNGNEIKLKEEDEAGKSKQYEFNKFIPIFDISKKADEHIVCGVVYAPNEVDSQGDTTTEEEIRKALYSYMEGPQ